ncbi:MAG: phenylacetate--CoA ligase family protein, partial [Candidatus Dormibacteria bacterium]
MSPASSDALHALPAPARAAAAAVALRAADASKWCALRSYPLFQAAATTSIPRWVEPLGARGALRAALHAVRHVPAYAQFVAGAGWVDDTSLSGSERLSRLPIMDKANYIQRYPTTTRCVDGRIPLIGTEMDESSGSSGTPYNWVRGAMELNEVHRQLSQFGRYVFREPVVTINCFSMGAWSTGMNTAQALHRNGLVKSPGPDLERVISTLRFLGPDYVYVITGYPPFLRELLEYGEANGVDWRQFRLYGIVGGEGMSEHLRDRLLIHFIAVFSAYGASDLDIGVAAETPISIFVRRAAAENSELRR